MSKSETTTRSPGQLAKSRRRRGLNVPLFSWSIAAVVVIAAIGAWRYKTASTAAARSFLSRAESFEKEGKWSEAAELLQRYLMVRPDDVDARRRLTLAIYESADAPGQRPRAITALYQSVGQHPDDNKLRVKLAELLRKSGDYRAALKEATAAAEDDPELEAAREVAIAKFALADQEDMSAISAIAAELLATAQKRPKDYELAIVTANVLREKPGLSIGNVDDLQAVADDLVVKAAAQNAEDVNAALAAYQYQRRYGLSTASADLEKIRAKWPENLDALLLEAEYALAGPKPDAAKGEKILREAIRVEPLDARAYLALGQQLVNREQLVEASKVLAEGRAKLPDDLSIGLQYVDALISANDKAVATDEFAKLSRSAKALAPQLTADARMLLDNRLRVQGARLALADKRFADVIGPMQEVLTATANEPVENRSREAMLAFDLMAQGLAAQGKWDLAAPYWDQLAGSLTVVTSRPNVDPRIKTYRAAALASAANAYHKAGMAAEATARFDELASLTDSPSVAVRQLQAHLALQARRPFEARQWGEFLASLEKVKQLTPPRWEAAAAEIEYLNLSGEDQQALALLEQLEKDESAPPELVRYLAVAYQRLGQSDRADRIVERFAASEAAESEKLLLKAGVLLGRGDYAGAMETLKLAEAKAPTPEAAVQIRYARLQAMSRSGRSAEAIAEVRKLYDPKQPNVPLLLLAYETALAAQDLTAAEEWDKALAATSANGTYDHRFLNAWRQSENYAALAQDARDRLAKEVVTLRSERPKWGPASALIARVDELQGNADGAVQNFKLAIELGDVRPKTFEQLINLLYARGDLGEAQRYLSLAASSADGNQQLEALVGGIAAQRGDLAGLIRIAREAVKRHPKDVRKATWLAQLMLANGDAQQALPLFEAAFKASPGNQQAWIGLFAAMTKSGREQDARELLAVLPNNSEMTASVKDFLAASAYELLSEPEKARQHFEAGLAADDANIGMRLRLARLLQRLDMLKACEQFEEILKREPANAEAKRDLVTSLAAVGGDAQWQRISALLADATGNGNSAADARLHALLTSQRGANREERLKSTQQARTLTEEKIKAAGPNAEDVDRLLLTGLLEQEAKLAGDAGKMKQAVASLEPLISGEKASSQNLLFVVQFLLRNSNELRTSLSDSPGAAEVRDEFLQAAEQHLKQLRDALGPEPKPQDRLQLLALEVALLDGNDRKDDIAAALKQFAESSLPKLEDAALRQRALSFLGEGYYKIDDYDSAERIFRELAEQNAGGIASLVQTLAAQDRPLDAVKECIAMQDREVNPAEIVSLLTSLVAQFEEVRQSPEVDAFVGQLLAADPSDVNLLCAVAALRVSEGDNDGATKLFRDVVALTPSNVLALNNLATLLGEVADSRGEAIQTVDKAITIAGRRPALLDTKGTIYLNGGQFAEAIECLEEAVAGDAHDPRYYFHLAAARYRGGDEVGAQTALAKARELKLDKSLLTVGDLQLLQDMERIPAVTPIAN